MELDGHDFHEKTKEQASGDKRRDRYPQRSAGPSFASPAQIPRSRGGDGRIVALANRRCMDDDQLENFYLGGGALAERIEERGLR